MTLSQGEHYELMNDLEDKLGKKTAVRLAEALPPFDWNELARQAEVDSKIDALDARLSGKIDRLSGEVDALDARLSGKIDRLSGEVDALDGRLSGRIDRLAGEVNALEHEVAAQAEVTKAGFAEMGSRLDAMDQRLEAMDQRWADRFEAFSHEMMHRVYGRMFAVCGVVVAIVAAIAT